MVYGTWGSAPAGGALGPIPGPCSRVCSGSACLCGRGTSGLVADDHTRPASAFVSAAVVPLACALPGRHPLGGGATIHPALQIPYWIQRELAAADARQAHLDVAFEVRHAHGERGSCLFLAEQHPVLRRRRYGCPERHCFEGTTVTVRGRTDAGPSLAANPAQRVRAGCGVAGSARSIVLKQPQNVLSTAS